MTSAIFSIFTQNRETQITILTVLIKSPASWSYKDGIYVKNVLRSARFKTIW